MSKTMLFKYFNFYLLKSKMHPKINQNPVQNTPKILLYLLDQKNRHIRIRHFLLPLTLKQQAELGIVDSRNPRDYMEIITELMN